MLSVTVYMLILKETRAVAISSLSPLQLYKNALRFRRASVFILSLHMTHFKLACMILSGHPSCGKLGEKPDHKGLGLLFGCIAQVTRQYCTNSVLVKNPTPAKAGAALTTTPGAAPAALKAAAKAAARGAAAAQGATPAIAIAAHDVSSGHYVQKRTDIGRRDGTANREHLNRQACLRLMLVVVRTHVVLGGRYLKMQQACSDAQLSSGLATPGSQSSTVITEVDYPTTTPTSTTLYGPSAEAATLSTPSTSSSSSASDKTMSPEDDVEAVTPRVVPSLTAHGCANVVTTSPATQHALSAPSLPLAAGACLGGVLSMHLAAAARSKPATSTPPMLPTTSAAATPEATTAASLPARSPSSTAATSDAGAATGPLCIGEGDFLSRLLDACGAGSGSDNEEDEAVVHARWELFAFTHLVGRVLPGCSNMDCTNLSGRSEAELPTQLCSGCRWARYCSKECQQAAWMGGHKAVCGKMHAAGPAVAAAVAAAAFVMAGL